MRSDYSGYNDTTVSDQRNVKGGRNHLRTTVHTITLNKHDLSSNFRSTTRKKVSDHYIASPSHSFWFCFLTVLRSRFIHQNSNNCGLFIGQES